MAVGFDYRYSTGGFILKLLLVIFLGIFLCAWGIRAFILAPNDFPVESTFEVREGDSLGGVAYRLFQERYIKSPEVFKIFMLALGTEKELAVGTYYFEAPITSIEVALKITGMEFGMLQHSITFPEGFTNKEIATRLENTFDGFDSDTFLSLAKEKEGYLFPDTYSFSPEVRPEEVIATLSDTFIKKTSDLENERTLSGRTQSQIITMASIIEKEAGDGEEARIIAGILWKRLDRGMLLQVDAPFLYLLGKSSAELTRSDLAIDSPYNTYKYKGLPPTPINNPGRAAIEAALRPIASPYFYYLHGTDGVVRYARTYEEHLANKKKYLQ